MDYLLPRDGDQLRKLQEQLYHLRWSTKDVAEQALQEGVKQAKVPGFTGWAVQEIINQALEKLEEIQVPMPDYALKSAGAAIIRSKTSPSLRDAKAKVFLYSLPVMDYMRYPELILEAENHPGNCWPFPGSQGHVFIKLSVPVVPRAITMDHVSGTAFHGESLSGAPKDFAVYGFKEEHEEQGTFLGQFTFLASLNPSQTFQLKNELPGVVNYIRLEVLSNWGHPDYTCLYRFRVHGDPHKDGGDRAVSSPPPCSRPHVSVAPPAHTVRIPGRAAGTQPGAIRLIATAANRVQPSWPCYAGWLPVYQFERRHVDSIVSFVSSPEKVLLEEEPRNKVRTAVRWNAMLAIAELSAVERALEGKEASLLQACFSSVFLLPPEEKMQDMGRYLFLKVSAW
ncbi:SUN domain-containing protein 3-like [Patagioenas fasciata]|uniref:SUN domain-containing protein 3-like n=1 Tax=Patagioenas fasciata TaxID=372321 RepID=UPI003A991296